TKPTPEALSALVSLAEDEPGVGAVGSVLVGEDGEDRVQACGGRVSFRTGLARHNRRIVARDRIDYLVGASLLVRWTALRHVGPLDERFFLYWEDTDLSFRLRAAGWE